MLAPEYPGMYDAHAGMHPGMAASLASLHPFFPQSRLPEAPLSEDDMALFMLLVTYSDALDALPLETTRSFSDLRELDAVLGAHLVSLTQRLQNLAAVIEDPSVSPGDRLLALKEVAEEARAYKMGGEDKIRVAVNTAEMISSHTEYIDSLLRSLTSLPSLGPYVREGRPQYKRLSELSSYTTPSESAPDGLFASTSNFNTMPMEAAAAGRRSDKTRPYAPDTTSSRTRDSHEASRQNKKRKVLPPSTSAQRSRAGDTQRGASSGAGKRRDTVRSGYQDESDRDSSDEHTEAYTNGTSADRLARVANRARARGGPAVDPDSVKGASNATWNSRRPGEATGDENEHSRSSGRSRPVKTSGNSGRDEQDEQRYCFCNNVSYGDMIGCDDDDCEREWFHLGCVGLSKPPQGTWYCDACLERRSQQARNKAKRGARPGRAAASPDIVSAPPRRLAGARR